MRNVILTGIPRSGTTLASALIDGLPNAVCLNEPIWHTARVTATPQDYARWLIGEFICVRKRLLSGEPIPDRRSPEGNAVTNYYRADPNTRKMENLFEVVPFTREGLTPDFTLAIKHNGPYLAVLNHLIDTGFFTIIAMVRHPLEVIASWRRLQLPISQGLMPGAVPFWPKMAELMQEEKDILVRQVKMYDFMCKRIHHFREQIHVLAYEELIKNPALLSEYVGSNDMMAQSLIEKPARDIPDEEKTLILEMLKAHGEHWQHFYPELERV